MVEHNEVILIGTMVCPLKVEKGIGQQGTPMIACCEASNVAMKLDDGLKCQEEWHMVKEKLLEEAKMASMRDETKIEKMHNY